VTLLAPATTGEDVPARQPPKYRLNGLDGFRAVAVTVVALFHFGVPGFSGGWIGPELFFVLSGYLITTLLLDRTSPGERGPSLRDFWMRRILRLYPAVLFLVAILVPAVALLNGLHDTAAATISPASLKSESLATIAYYANWHLIAEHTGYFAASTALLKHTWSLAIEEQFYLVWPIVFTVIMRSRRSWRGAGIAVAGAGSLASAAYAASSVSSSNLNTVYYSTQTNAFHLLIGVGLAFATYGWTPGWRARKRLNSLATPAIAVIVLFVGLASTTSGTPRLWMFQGGQVILDLAAAALIVSLVYGDPLSYVSRTFNLRAVVWLGSISYGVYLWHYPLAVLLTPTSTGLPRPILVLVLITATLSIAAFSHRFVEVVVRQGLIVSRRYRWTLYAVGFSGSMALVAGAQWLVRP
jgi:peptidoglycan/LPS O-acetylase OafA/YrhL